jgi:hypothetical protein
MKPLIKFTIFFLIAGLAFSSCKKEAVPAKINQPPIANAGPDMTVILPIDSVQLDGKGTDLDGRIVSYSWSQSYGLSSPNILNPNYGPTIVKGLTEGVYVFELAVTDEGGLSATDDLIVNVISPVPPGTDPCLGCWDY